jgi:hypothetical protein
MLVGSSFEVELRSPDGGGHRQWSSGEYYGCQFELRSRLALSAALLQAESEVAEGAIQA